MPLTIAARLCTWLAASAKPNACTIGIPPPTLPSKATARRDARAWAKILGPCSARSALFAVTTCLPASSAARTYSIAGSIPPMVSITTSTSGSSITCRASPVSLTPSSETPRGFRRSRTAAHFQRTGPARARADALGMLGQEPRHAGSHRAQPDQPNRYVVHYLISPIPAGPSKQ